MDLEQDWTTLPDEVGGGEPKYIMVFCDGTGKDGEKLAKKEVPTNVYRLYQLIERLPDWLDLEGKSYRKIAYYIPGVGSRLHGTAGLLAKLHGMATVHAVVTAYLFIAQYYKPGDRICLFGYSRGAFAARKVANLIFHCGLSATRESLLQQWVRREKPVDWHKNSDGFELEMNGHPLIPIRYLGVWDTVCAVRDLPRIAQVKDMLGIREEEIPRNVEHAFHAVAFHENRKPFRVTLLEDNNLTNMQEVWFPGCHSDVGGGGEEVTDLPKISLEWMMSHLDIFNSTQVKGMTPLDYAHYHSLNPHNSSRYEKALAKDIDKNLLSLDKLSARTGWNRIGNINKLTTTYGPFPFTGGGNAG
ncbi:unnamed protein product [Rhizoctonia solani]|uniref:T6SS Phospholipase effector Tle1-like catalytic domain-containing protein n=1 Tax=Rhizoctonia solani TaxID=456999 RepID=A0A8H3CZ84_9AGAM|nr:unnamed protein product [Rhizoctonia solani]